MNKVPSGLTVIYFDDKDKNIYTELPRASKKAVKARLPRGNDSHQHQKDSRQAARLTCGYLLAVKRVIRQRQFHLAE